MSLLDPCCCYPKLYLLYSFHLDIFSYMVRQGTMSSARSVFDDSEHMIDSHIKKLTREEIAELEQITKQRW